MSPHPYFRRPPVHEVALSTQFDPIVGLNDLQLALLWREFERKYPKTDVVPALRPMTEQFEEPDLSSPNFPFQILTSPPANRFWFKSSNEEELIQVQHDRFIYNWRRIDRNDQYPGHVALFEKYQQELSTFVDFLKSQKLGDFIPNQCEVTYIDHLVQGEGWENYSQIGDVITVLSPQHADNLLSNLEDVKVAMRYIIPGEAGQPRGRLYFAADPAYRIADGKPLIALNFVARGAPTSQDISGIADFFQVGHDWIIRAFTSFMSPRMQQLWGRDDGNS